MRYWTSLHVRVGLKGGGGWEESLSALLITNQDHYMLTNQ